MTATKNSVGCDVTDERWQHLALSDSLSPEGPELGADQATGWRAGVSGTVRQGPYEGWPAVVCEVRGDVLEVEVALTGAVFELEATGLDPHDSVELPEGEAEGKLLEAIFGQSEPLEPAPEPPPAPEPVRRRSTVIDGVRLAHVVHSMVAARWPDERTSARLWTAGAATVYRSDDGCGNSVAVAWSDSDLVLAIFDHESERSPFNDLNPPDPLERMTGLPSKLEPLAMRALYTLVAAGASSPVPMITTAAWARGEELVSDDSWQDFFLHGGHLVQRLLNPPEVAMRGCRGWQVHCSLTEAQAALALDLLESGRTKLTESDRTVLLSCADPVRGELCCESVLEQLGIAWRLERV